jgi:hypothetical protein
MKHESYHIHILEFPSVRLSVCNTVCLRLTFYWKELRSCNMSRNFRLLLAQKIGYLTFFLDLVSFSLDLRSCGKGRVSALLLLSRNVGVQKIKKGNKM